MSEPVGVREWVIAEGYIPAESHGPQPEMTSHETVCILNTNDQDAHIEITIYYANREPVGPYRITVPARRTTHLRFNNLKDPHLRKMIIALGRQALHARTLGFIHPGSGEYLEFTTEMPEDMATLVEYLRGSVS